jgi:hypothetical protein
MAAAGLEAAPAAVADTQAASSALGDVPGVNCASSMRLDARPVSTAAFARAV